MGKYGIGDPKFTTRSIESGGHPDYKRNLETAQNFIIKTKKSLLKGMDVKICDGEHIQKALMMISWSPPREAPIGNCATPISLHQPSGEVGKQIEGVFNTYLKCVGNYQKTSPVQAEFLDPAMKA